MKRPAREVTLISMKVNPFFRNRVADVELIKNRHHFIPELCSFVLYC